jgi:hypothetical protein
MAQTGIGRKRKRELSTIIPPSNLKRGKKLRKEGSRAIPNLEDDYMEKGDTHKRQPTTTVTMCHAGLICCLLDNNVVLQGKALNGSLCCKCQQALHHVCLYNVEQEVYCLNCYKHNVVSQCKTETLFEDLLKSEERAKKAQTGPKHKESDLIKSVDNFLKVHGLSMTVKDYYKWYKDCQQLLFKKQPVNKRGENKEESGKKAIMIAQF